jgi:hemolysin III
VHRPNLPSLPSLPSLPTLPKPRLRGRLHQVAFFVSIPAGIALVALARATEARVAAMIFAATLSALYGVSALYHRRDWSSRAHRFMKHLDHSMIFVFIAGSYTPVTLLALHPAWGITLLILAWSGAAVGVLVTVLRLERWHGVGFAMYLVLGWLAVFAAPQLVSSLSRVELALLVFGGVLYTVGAVVLARKRPDPHPAVFGYHEVWHTFVVSANVCHFLLVLLLVRG